MRETGKIIKRRKGKEKIRRKLRTLRYIERERKKKKRRECQ